MKDNTICSVSVIIPFFNACQTIEVALLSVLEQSLLPSEIIIVDDCSDEENASILSKVIANLNSLSSTKTPIKLLTLDANKGASYARNTAVNNAGYKYLAFLDSDDKWCEDKIKYQFEFMEKYSLFMSGHGYIFNLNESGFNVPSPGYRLVNRFEFIYTNPFFTPTIMVRRDGFHNFDPSFRRADDYKCWLCNFKSGSVAIMHCQLAGGFKHPIGVGGLTGSMKKMHDSYVDVLKSLCQEKVISSQFYYLARFVEFIKYPLRIIINKL
ncbi:MAG: glycosyltransferase family 2 protein [Shewanella sp.]